MSKLKLNITIEHDPNDSEQILVSHTMEDEDNLLDGEPPELALVSSMAQRNEEEGFTEVDPEPLTLTAAALIHAVSDVTAYQSMTFQYLDSLVNRLQEFQDRQDSSEEQLDLPLDT